MSYTWVYSTGACYGVATICRLLKITGLFCKRALQKRPIFCKETYDFKEPANRSHPIQRHSSWPKWIACVLRYSPWLKQKYWDTVLFKWILGARNTETQFVTHMNGVCTETHFSTQMYSRGAQHQDTVCDSNEWCVHWDRVLKSNYFQGCTLLRHSSWLKSTACVLRHSFDSNESTATQFDSYVFHGRTLLRHISWPKWIACVLRHSPRLKRKYWDTVWLKWIPQFYSSEF